MFPNTTSGRYNRQVILPKFGENGQKALANARVLVIGAGGLGGPVLQYLAAAGVGHIGIVDGDTVDLTNLHRQVLFTMADIGLPKATTAQARLRALNPEISITAYEVFAHPQNLIPLLADYDLVVDGTDNFAARYLINDACVLTGKTLVFGAVSQFEGQVAVFDAALNYRDLFPQPPSAHEVLNCAEAGVLGVLPGIVGAMMANEAIKMITGIGQSLRHQLATYNALTLQMQVFRLQPAPGTRSLIPATVADYQQLDYAWLCSAHDPLEIATGRFLELVSQPGALVIDIREMGELPEITDFPHAKIPLSVLSDKIGEITADTVLLCCQSGKRSLNAARQLVRIFGESKTIYSLQGGFLQYEQHKKT